MSVTKLVGRDLIRVLAPLLGIQAPERVASITLTIPQDELVTAMVEFRTDSRLLGVDWAQEAGRDGSAPEKGKGKGGSAK